MLLEFLMTNVRELKIEKLVTKAIDEMDLPPFYLLCSRGYKESFCPTKQKIENFRSKMIKIMIPDTKFVEWEKEGAKWDHEAR